MSEMTVARFASDKKGLQPSYQMVHVFAKYKFKPSFLQKKPNLVVHNSHLRHEKVILTPF